MKETRTLKEVECQGTPYEIGLRYGEGCRDSLLRSWRSISNLLHANHYVTGRYKKGDLATWASPTATFVCWNPARDEEGKWWNNL
ncbi:MAG: hypothetical protein A4E53_04366 [Pelotomaculum sp. PtaB.Bin104]|nr:MAG: hypothetical protein A4E53_04366 [Pelotomaculum sp. PtaB.Bin104]